MRRPMCFFAAVFLSLSLLGISCLETGRYSRNTTVTENNLLQEETNITFTGTIVDKQQVKSVYGNQWKLVLNQVVVLSTPLEEYRIEGKMICHVKETKGESFLLGRRVKMEGVFTPWEVPSNPGQFDLRKWYLTQGIHGQVRKCTVVSATKEFSKLQETLWRARKRAAEFYQKQLGEKDGSVISAMVLGDKNGLDEETKQRYQRSGISHILSISGLHLTLLGMTLLKVLQKSFLGRKGGAAVCSIFMIGYCIFTGASVSAVRATIMFLVSLLAILLGRSYDSLSALAFAALLQGVKNPYVILNSGFQFSFLAVIGATIVAPRLEEIFPVKQKWKKSLLLSISVMLVSLPILISNYGTYPWFSVFLNILIVPLMSFLLLFAIVLLFSFFIPHFFLDLNAFTAMFCSTSTTSHLLIKFVLVVYSVMEKIFTEGIKGILMLYEMCCRLGDYIPFQSGYMESPAIWKMMIYYGILFLVFSKVGKNLLFWKKLGILVALQVLTLSMNFGAEITMLNVGQGDGIVIRNENGRVYLSDCGSSSVSQVGKYRLIPFLKQKGYGNIQGIFLSHLDQDHINGALQLMQVAKEEKIKIHTLFLPVSVKENQEEQEILEELSQLAGENKIKIQFLKRGDKVIDEKLQMSCLSPCDKDGSKNSNNGSLVLSLHYGDFKMLLTGDLEKEGEIDLLEEIDQLGQYQVLKVAHHGSAGSSHQEFLQTIKPKVSLLSCGKNNSYGHPAAETVERLQQTGTLLFDTRYDGAVTIYPRQDGRLFVKTFLKGGLQRIERKQPHK